MMLKEINGGARETLVNELTVTPRGSPWLAKVITVTGAGTIRITLRRLLFVSIIGLF